MLYFKVRENAQTFQAQSDVLLTFFPLFANMPGNVSVTEAVPKGFPILTSDCSGRGYNDNRL